MPLLILGINHNTAPVDIREQVVFDSETLPEVLGEIDALAGVEGSVVVSTCNRTEIIADAARPEGLRAWLLGYHGLGERVRECLFALEGEEAVTHLFRVACGLDSVVLGEPQITGQLKDAYRIAHETGHASPQLRRLFQHAFAVAKKVRTDTAIGASPVSVAYATVQLARGLFDDFERNSALLVGAGPTIELVARHLRRQGIGRMFIANRSIDRARELAREFEGYPLPLSALGGTLPEADILISSTASPAPLISRQSLADALATRRRRPMFAADIAVPRDIEAAAKDLSDLYLYTVDDLEHVITRGMNERRAAATEADEIVALEVSRFRNAERVLDAVPVIKAMRGRGHAIKDEVLAEARRRIEKGVDAGETLEYLAAALTNKLLHAPSERLRNAGEDADEKLMSAARELFGLSEK